MILEKAIAKLIEEINKNNKISHIEINFMHIKKERVKTKIYNDLKNFNAVWF